MLKENNVFARPAVVVRLWHAHLYACVYLQPARLYGLLLFQ